MKLWLRAVDAHGESMCEPKLIIGTVVRENGRPYFRVDAYSRGSRKTRCIMDGEIVAYMYVDPKTGQPLPYEYRPMLVVRQVRRGQILSLNSRRLSTFMPEGTTIEVAHTDAWGNPVLPTTEPTIPTWAEEARTARPRAIRVDPAGRIVDTSVAQVTAVEAVALFERPIVEEHYDDWLEDNL